MAVEFQKYYIQLDNGQVVSRNCWTGGDTPPKDFILEIFRELRQFYFRDQVKDCGGLDLWKEQGTTALEQARIFWNRARLDAWITCKRQNLIEQTK